MLRKSNCIMMATLCIFLVCCDAKDVSSEPVRNAAIPQAAKWDKTQKRWVLSGLRSEKMKVRIAWNVDGRMAYRFFTFQNIRTDEYFYPNGKPSMRGQSRLTKESMHGELHWQRYGRLLQFDSSGAISRISCVQLKDLADIDGALSCGKEINFKSGTRPRSKHHRVKCRAGCGEFQAFIPRGEYYIIGSSLRVRSAPSVKAKQRFALRRNERVMVVRDTRKIETYSFETAPWVKVKTKDGREGYAFGGFLRKVGTRWYDLTK